MNRTCEPLSNFPAARLPALTLARLRELEADLSAETGQTIVLVAYASNSAATDNPAQKSAGVPSDSVRDAPDMEWSISDSIWNLPDS